MKIYKKAGSIVLAFVLMLSVISSSLSMQIVAASAPVLSAENKTVSPGEQFTVAVSLSNATSVYGGNFTLQYDSSLLTADSYAFGSIVSGHTKNCNLNYQSAGNLIRFTFSGAEALTSSGTLVTFTFTAKAQGTATLKFNAYKMYDENGSSITSSANGSIITIAEEPVASPTISITSKTVTVGEKVTVPVVISNSADVYGGNFTLQYDSSLLTADSYTFGSIVSGHTKNCNLNYQSAGNLIRFTFSGAEALTSSGTLVTFTFTAKAKGTATLKFNAYKMYDENGSSITTNTSNGSITINPKPDIDTVKPTGSISSTNNAATSQTVTLKLSDNAGVAGYYWGTSSTYSNNTYTSTSASSVTKTISSAGTYYLVVKDTSGNVSNPYSITFYKTTLNANGGSVSPSYVITKSGTSVTLPIPTRTGYSFVGWGTSSTSTSGVKSISPTSSETYYAIWENTQDDLITGKCGDNVDYELNLNTKVLRIYGNGAMWDWGYNDAPWYEYRENISEVVIEKNVTSIGEYAFYDCDSLTSITIPDSVTSIGDGTFRYCESLTSVTIPDSVTSIGDWAFSNCESLTSITIPDSVTSIGDAAFYDCDSLTSVTIGNGVTSIGDGVFYDCDSLTSVTIPDGVTNIGVYAFAYCDSLTSINVNANNKYYSSVDGVLFNKNKTELIQYPIGNKRNSYTIPDSVTSIGYDAFYGCDSLTSITIPDSVTSIGEDAFRGCNSLTSITIPDSVTSIGDNAFQSCDSLTSITIPDSVTSIWEDAFEYCDNLTIKCYANSTALQYAIDNDIPYELLSDETKLEGKVYCQFKDNNTMMRFIAEVDIEDVTNANSGEITVFYNGDILEIKNITGAYKSLYAAGQVITAPEGKCYIISNQYTGFMYDDMMSVEFTLDNYDLGLSRDVIIE